MRFSNIIKPTHNCIMSCKYCYIEDDKTMVMRVESLENVIKKTFEYSPLRKTSSIVDFIWHGGEPLMAGIGFYKRAIRLQQKHNNGIKYTNSVQTNGVLLNNLWIDFFKSNGFQISISIDGPKRINDRSRLYRDGRSTFNRVMKVINMVKKADIPMGVCVVISKQNKDDVDEIYNFLANEKLNFNVIPLNRCGSALKNYNDLGLAPQEYALPWIRMYNRWFYAGNSDYVYCSDFVFKTAAVLTGTPKDCIGVGKCSFENVSVNPEGFVYPCATLTEDIKWQYGNINYSTLEELMKSPAAQHALSRKTHSGCTKCKWQHICNGGCVARAVKFHGEIDARDYYCPSLYKIYEHIEKCVKSEGIGINRVQEFKYQDAACV